MFEQPVPINDGMRIIDVNGEYVGKVKFMQFDSITGDEDNPDKDAKDITDAAAARYHEDDFFRQLVDDMVGESQTPEMVAEQLMSHGYIRVTEHETSGPAKHVVVTSSQIERIENGELHLNVAKDQLALGNTTV